MESLAVDYTFNNTSPSVISPKHDSPFCVDTDQPMVAIVGKRAGYIQLAPIKAVTSYSELPNYVLTVAKMWAAILEKDAGAQRVYWLTLAEEVRHLHIHLYPRWPEDTEKSLTLFEQRNEPNQPEWPAELTGQLHHWAALYHVELVYP